MNFKRTRPPQAGGPDIVAMVTAEVKRVLPGASFDAAGGQFLVPVPGGRARISADSVYAQCAHTDPQAWPEIVRRWAIEVDHGVRAADHAADHVNTAQLRLRVTPRWTEQDAATIVHQPIPFEFDGVVVIADATQRWSYLTPARAQALGNPWDLVTAGLRQTITQEIFDIDVRDHDVAGQRVRLLAKDDCPYVTTALLSLERFTPDSAQFGALIIAPTYSAVGIHEVRDRGALDLIPTLSAMATDLYHPALAPCSTEVYWWHRQVFYRVGVRTSSTGTPVLDLPEDLRPVADSLG